MRHVLNCNLQGVVCYTLIKNRTIIFALSKDQVSLNRMEYVMKINVCVQSPIQRKYTCVDLLGFKHHAAYVIMTWQKWWIQRRLNLVQFTSIKTGGVCNRNTSVWLTRKDELLCVNEVTSGNMLVTDGSDTLGSLNFLAKQKEISSSECS